MLVNALKIRSCPQVIYGLERDGGAMLEYSMRVIRASIEERQSKKSLKQSKNLMKFIHYIKQL